MTTNPPPAPRLNLLHAIQALLALVFVSAVFALWIGDPGEPGRALATLLASELAFAVAALLVLTGAGAVGELPLSLPTLRQGIGAILLGLGALLFSAAGPARLYRWVDSQEYTEMLVRLFAELDAQIGTPGILALTVILVPLCEELLFRGVIQRAFQARLKPGTAIVVSALLFGIVHGHPVHGLIAFILGLAAGYALLATGTLWAAILVHAANNAAAILPSLGDAALDENTASVLPWWVLLPALGVLWVGGWLVGSQRPPVGSTGPENGQSMGESE